MFVRRASKKILGGNLPESSIEVIEEVYLDHEIVPGNCQLEKVKILE